MFRVKPYLALLPLLALFGCNNLNPPIQGRQDPYSSDQIQFTSTELRDLTAVSAPRITRDAGSGLLYVTVPIRSTTDYTLYVDYRVTFFDANHMPLDRSPSWLKTLTLEPNTPQQVTVNSSTAAAVDFQMDFRLAR